MEQIRVVVNGIGAAGVSICKMLLGAGVMKLVPVDREGAIVRGETYTNPMWNWLTQQPQVEAKTGTLKDVIQGADVFIGVSRGGLLNEEDIKGMTQNSIVFARANLNPDPSLGFRCNLRRPAITLFFFQGCDHTICKRFVHTAINFGHRRTKCCCNFGNAQSFFEVKQNPGTFYARYSSVRSLLMRCSSSRSVSDNWGFAFLD